MRVFKFGGASVKDVDSIKNLSSILKNQYVKNEDLVVVISAMGKMTNAFESLLFAYLEQSNEQELLFEEIKQFHLEIMNQLFSKDHKIYEEVSNHLVEIEWLLEEEVTREKEYYYGQMVSMGEILSTSIVASFLNEEGHSAEWLDARGLIRTDNQYRSAKVDWSVTEELINSQIKRDKNVIYITQGFIGGTSENFTTTLGREGSDYSAAIFASILDAKEVVIWKDVGGMYSADPNVFPNAIKINHISFHEAIELAYYGASVIHPKTIKPLQNKGIPLYVKSFLQPEMKGTIIDNDFTSDKLIPSFILKPSQTLVSIAAKDFSFIVESQLKEIFNAFDDYGLTINLMQNSAISFSVCLDALPELNQLLNELRLKFKVSFNEGLSLLTIRHYNDEVIEELLLAKKVLLEQKTRTTARFVFK